MPVHELYSIRDHRAWVNSHSNGSKTGREEKAKLSAILSPFFPNSSKFRLGSVKISIEKNSSWNESLRRSKSRRDI